MLLHRVAFVTVFLFLYLYIIWHYNPDTGIHVFCTSHLNKFPAGNNIILAPSSYFFYSRSCSSLPPGGAVTVALHSLLQHHWHITEVTGCVASSTALSFECFLLVLAWGRKDSCNNAISTEHCTCVLVYQCSKCMLYVLTCISVWSLHGFHACLGRLETLNCSLVCAWCACAQRWTSVSWLNFHIQVWF